MVWAIITGAIVYVLMLADVFHYILQALAYQGIFVVAWVGIALTHILSGKYHRLVGTVVEYRAEEVPAFNPKNLDTKALAQVLKENKLSCTFCSINPPDANPISKDPKVRDKAVKHWKKVIETAAAVDSELVGGLFYFNYPGGSGLTSGAVFGRIAGSAAARAGQN